MTDDAGPELSHYDGVPCDALAVRCRVPELRAVARCHSTMDLAHARAASGAGDGSVVVALEQTAGRGRTGNRWHSAADAGVWASVVVRQTDIGPNGVLALRTGLALGAALAPFTPDPPQLKWPNDVFVAGRKLAGILTEARWRGDRLEWLVVGVGVNVLPDVATGSAALRPGTVRSDVLCAVVGAVRAAAQATGPLTDAELSAFAARDLAGGRRITGPVTGTVLGLSADGGLRVRTDMGDTVCLSGSLVFEAPLPE